MMKIKIQRHMPIWKENLRALKIQPQGRWENDNNLHANTEREMRKGREVRKGESWILIFQSCQKNMPLESSEYNLLLRR